MSFLHHAQKVSGHVRDAHRHLVGLPTVLIVTGIISSGVMGAYLLRQNNLGMVALRREVVQMDELGSRDHTEQALQALQHYVSRHMNASTTMDLQASYQREVARRQRTAANRLGNINLYNQAEAVCGREGRQRGIQLAECINQKLSGESGGIVDLPNVALYRYSFVSPGLSLDLAGLTLVICGVFCYAGLHQLTNYFVRRQLNKHIKTA